MVAVQLDRDVHDFLLTRVQEFGETPSDVLRRELGIGSSQSGSPIAAEAKHQLADFLKSPRLRQARGVVGRFLEILAGAYLNEKDRFSIVLEMQGRGRTYFSKSKAEIENSGNSTQPRQIPGSPYWVMTNSPTRQKKEMLRKVLGQLGYSAEAVGAAVRAIDA